MNRYRDRRDAGIRLASKLTEMYWQGPLLVLALPRGGVPVAYEVARALQAPLDVFIVRKLGVPGHAELAMGALASGHVQVFNEEIVSGLHVSEADIKRVIAKEEAELKRREHVYRRGKPFPSLKDKTVILVDDGIATGASMRAAVMALRQLQAAKIVIAVPVADQEIIKQMASLVDQVVCPMQPRQLNAVGAWYEDFSQTEDQEVDRLLEQASHSLLDSQ